MIKPLPAAVIVTVGPGTAASHRHRITGTERDPRG